MNNSGTGPEAGFRYFILDEFECSETGENRIKPAFVAKLDELRSRCDFPFAVTSGYRSPMHSKERDKPAGPGQHSLGIAADIAVSDGVQRRRIVTEADAMGFGGIGVAKSFVHVDDREGQSVLWTY